MKTFIILSPLLLVTLFLSGCGLQTSDNPPIVQENMQEMQEIIVAHWRNDTIKTDYVFNLYEGKQLLTKLTDNSSSECTYEFDRENKERRSIEVWFKCPQPDWPGYAELHEFEFSEDYKSFIDTLYIQGIASRVDGEFLNVNKK